MIYDPAIEEIREVRRIISEKYGHNTKALIQHYIELQKNYPDKVFISHKETLTNYDSSDKNKT